MDRELIDSLFKNECGFLYTTKNLLDPDEPEREEITTTLFYDETDLELLKKEFEEKLKNAGMEARLRKSAKRLRFDKMGQNTDEVLKQAILTFDFDYDIYFDYEDKKYVSRGKITNWENSKIKEEDKENKIYYDKEREKIVIKEEDCQCIHWVLRHLRIEHSHLRARTRKKDPTSEKTGKNIAPKREDKDPMFEWLDDKSSYKHCISEDTFYVYYNNRDEFEGFINGMIFLRKNHRK